MQNNKLYKITVAFCNIILKLYSNLLIYHTLSGVADCITRVSIMKYRFKQLTIDICEDYFDMQQLNFSIVLNSKIF